jgi:hypothetical protein
MIAGSVLHRTEAMLRDYCRQVDLKGKPGLERVSRLRCSSSPHGHSVLPLRRKAAYPHEMAFAAK